MVCAVLLAAAGCAVPDRIEKRGNFQVEYFRMDAFGHTSNRRALIHMKGLTGRTRVTDRAVSFHIVNNDADRIIYETCGRDAGPSRYGPTSACRHMYFDGHTDKTYEIGRGLKVAMSALDDGNRWSANGRFVAIADQYELVILDMQTGRSVAPAAALRLEAPYYPEKWLHRELRWGAWSPDGIHGAAIVMSPHGPGLPVYEWDEELYSVDGVSGALTLVASHTGDLGGSGDRKLWRSADFRWNSGEVLPPR